MSPQVERLSIEGPAGTIEARVEDPGAAEPATAPSSGESQTDASRVVAPRYAVICHPHPLFGGTMENKVVTTVARALNQAGIPTLRFNFRGVGASEGIFDGGVGETGDAEAVAAWGEKRWPGRGLVIAGFSFGGYVALRLAQQRPPQLLITIAPAVQRFDMSSLAVPRCPWLVVQGDADDVVDPSAVAAWADGLDPRPRLVKLPGAGHFFHGRLHELRDIVIDTVRGD